MEELQVIETTSGRQFKPWATKDDVQDPASVTAITSEIASGKQAIAAAINAKGGSASATESFSELAEAVEEIPNFSDMVKLAGILAKGSYNKNALQGHEENVFYGKTEIIDNVDSFKSLYQYIFQYWDLLEVIKLPSFTGSGSQDMQSNYFAYCRSLKTLYLPSCSRWTPYFVNDTNNILTITVGTIIGGNCSLYAGEKKKLRNFTLGEGTDVNLDLRLWVATNVIKEGQSGIDELNNNLYNNLLTKLYDHSQDGQTRTLRIGWLAKVTAENIAYANAKGWTLTT